MTYFARFNKSGKTTLFPQFAIDDRCDAFIAKAGEFAKDGFDPLKQILVAYQVSSLSTTMSTTLPISRPMQHTTDIGAR